MLMEDDKLHIMAPHCFGLCIRSGRRVLYARYDDATVRGPFYFRHNRVRHRACSQNAITMLVILILMVFNARG